MSFDLFDLDRTLLAGIRKAGWTEPTPIQQRAIPEVLAGRDLLGTAQTGTGKTAAFVLPILQRLLPGARGRLRALIVVPTRELADQIREHCELLGARTGLRCATIYGGVGRDAQLRALRKGFEIIVACPGRLLDHVGERTADLSQVEIAVLDEADRLCDMGFLPDVRRILEHLPRERQTLFFSATMPAEIRRLADSILRDPATVQVDRIAPARTVSHAIYPATDALRRPLLLALVADLRGKRVLVFARTKHRARALARALGREGHRVAELQGNLSQGQRQVALDGFRGGRYDVLVATDIAARGLDIDAVSHVINYDMPDSVDSYTHRIGRTGRAELTGEALTLATGSDLRLIRQIEQVLGKPIERRRLETFEYGALDPVRVLDAARASANAIKTGRRLRTPAPLRRFG